MLSFLLQSSVIFCLLLNQLYGSEVKFQSWPREVKVGLTHQLTLRCSLEDALNVSGDVIIGRRDVTQTVEEVTSLVVMHHRKDVASITHKHQAKVLDGSTNVKASGNLSTSPQRSEVRGVIELCMNTPTREQLGEYRCEVNAVSESGHNTVFSSTLAVSAVNPSIDDVVHEVVALRRENIAVKATLNSLVEQTVPNLEFELKESRHVERGTLQCGNVNNWVGRAGHVTGNIWFTSVSRKFKRSYRKAPVVFLSVSYMSKFPEQPMSFAIALANVTSSGFTVTCSTHKGFILTGLAVDWMSVPQ